MGPETPADGQLVLTGATDRAHAGRDLVRFDADSLPTAQRVQHVSARLVLEAPSGQARPCDVVFWFGYAEEGAEASYPYQVGLTVSFSPSPTPGTQDVVMDGASGSDGGFLIPAKAIPVVLLGVFSSQSSLTPLLLHVGGTSPSGLNVTSINWRLPKFTQETIYDRSELILNDNVPSPVPNSGTLVPVKMQAGMIGFRASATAAASPVSLDFDVSFEDASGKLIAESNSPLASEALAFHAFNLDPNATQYQVRVVEASGKAGSYSLLVEVFKETVGDASKD